MLELLSSILPVDTRKEVKGMGQLERGQGMWEDNEQMEMEQKGLEGSEAKVVNGKGPRERSEGGLWQKGSAWEEKWVASGS